MSPAKPNKTKPPSSQELGEKKKTNWHRHDIGNGDEEREKKLQGEICYTDFYENPNIQLTNESRIFFYKLWESLRELVLLWRIGERKGRGEVGRYHSWIC